MSSWWNNLTGFQRFFWGMAIPFTVLFIIEMIIMAMGIDNSGDFDGDLSSSGDVDNGIDIDIDDNSDMKIPLNFRLFTIRNFIIFGAIFSWAGIVGIKNNYSKFKTLVFAFSLAFVVVLILSIIFCLLLKATQSGTMDLKNAIGSEGEVYFTIPENGKGEGKIQVIIQGALRELEAISNKGEIRTGEKVRVIGINEKNKLIVEPIILIDEGEI
ncbi:hypothetical protein CLTEP_11630 [Clostridium tepidiprofundi DSM 19306]|uniref:Uncharacterized protein n=1 Tax=Clostridium tepidiprofundi DSM 19306 TaxID=1121338 RepID=A0A151B4L8_9CLOT|nr:NfeD family protein [Clostridium tepidiprofundi]KYH34848.1 hypothetical protein CLTEP_11630 [Clostridium tepidiprofundi DSM 19306]